VRDASRGVECLWKYTSHGAQLGASTDYSNFVGATWRITPSLIRPTTPIDLSLFEQTALSVATEWIPWRGESAPANFGHSFKGVLSDRFLLRPKDMNGWSRDFSLLARIGRGPRD